jgi:hypothetical protein
LPSSSQTSSFSSPSSQTFSFFSPSSFYPNSFSQTSSSSQPTSSYFSFNETNDELKLTTLDVLSATNTPPFASSSKHQTPTLPASTLMVEKLSQPMNSSPLLLTQKLPEQNNETLVKQVSFVNGNDNEEKFHFLLDNYNSINIPENIFDFDFSSQNLDINNTGNNKTENNNSNDIKFRRTLLTRLIHICIDLVHDEQEGFQDDCDDENTPMDFIYESLYEVQKKLKNTKKPPSIPRSCNRDWNNIMENMTKLFQNRGVSSKTSKDEKPTAQTTAQTTTQTIIQSPSLTSPSLTSPSLSSLLFETNITNIDVKTDLIRRDSAGGTRSNTILGMTPQEYIK